MWQAFAGQFASQLGGSLGSSLGGGIAGQPSGPNLSQADSRSFMDGSGFTVATGGSKATGGRSGGGSMQASGAPAAGAEFVQPGGPVGASLGGMGPMLGLALVGAAAWFLGRE